MDGRENILVSNGTILRTAQEITYGIMLLLGVNMLNYSPSPQGLEVRKANCQLICNHKSINVALKSGTRSGDAITPRKDND